MISYLFILNYNVIQYYISFRNTIYDILLHLDLEMNFKLFLNCLDNNVTNKKSLDQFQVDTCTLRITITYYLRLF